MAYESKKPSIKITLERELFNNFVSLLDRNIKAQFEEENFSAIAERLKEKILNYSIKIKNDDGMEFAIVRFFPNEASNMMYQLLSRIEPNDEITDYYSTLSKKSENK